MVLILFLLTVSELLTRAVEMEMKKLHMGTMSYGFDSMDEVAHQLQLAFGASAEQGMICSYQHIHSTSSFSSSYETAIIVYGSTTGDSRSAGHVVSCTRRRVESCSLPQCKLSSRLAIYLFMPFPLGHTSNQL